MQYAVIWTTRALAGTYADGLNDGPIGTAIFVDTHVCRFTLTQTPDWQRG